MIIRCRKCETSFRFDDRIMIGEGVWVQCSRCVNVFFVENLSGQLSYARLLPRMKESEDAIADTARAGSLAKEFGDMASVERESEPKQRNAWLKPAEVKVKKQNRPVLNFFAFLSLVLLVNILLAVLYLGFFPNGRQRVADALSQYFLWAENIVGQGQSGPVWSYTVLKDVRQHFVNNFHMGNICVVEGSIVNKGKYPLTGAKIRGMFYNSAGSIIGEWTSFCGKVLTDAELATSSESELKHMLSDPLGNNVTGDRINPNGRIPFMVVLAHHDQQVVVKTAVIIPGAATML